MTNGADPRVKITGLRSLQSKYHRLALELENDAARVRADHGDNELAQSIMVVAIQLNNIQIHLKTTSGEPG